MVKKLIILALVLFIFITCFSTGVNGIKIWPGKLWIDVNQWYDDVDRVNIPRIQIINTESYDIEISIRIDNPSIQIMDEGYSVIPDVSWITTVPDQLIIPPGESDFVEIHIKVPESEQSSNYNKKWEVLAVVSPPLKSGPGLNIQTELGVKLFIKTPEGAPPMIEFYHIFLGILLFLFISLVIGLYTKKKSRKSTVYYFKKKRGHSP